MQTRDIGNAGEDAAAVWLRQQGFSIVVRNFTTRLGEVDIIALRGELLVFVEVKTRKTNYFSLSHVITQTKQKRIVRAAKQYIQNNHIIDKACRFDVALVLQNGGDFAIEYIENAFQGK